jgi:hypothetical protein
MCWYPKQNIGILRQGKTCFLNRKHVKPEFAVENVVLLHLLVRNTEVSGIVAQGLGFKVHR